MAQVVLQMLANRSNPTALQREPVPAPVGLLTHCCAQEVKPPTWGALGVAVPSRVLRKVLDTRSAWSAWFISHMSS